MTLEKAIKMIEDIRNSCEMWRDECAPLDRLYYEGRVEGMNSALETLKLVTGKEEWREAAIDRVMEGKAT